MTAKKLPVPDTLDLPGGIRCNFDNPIKKAPTINIVRVVGIILVVMLMFALGALFGGVCCGSNLNPSSLAITNQMQDMDTFERELTSWQVLHLTVFPLKLRLPDGWSVTEQNDVSLSSPDFRVEGATVVSGFSVQIGLLSNNIKRPVNFDQFLSSEVERGENVSLLRVGDLRWILRSPTSAAALVAGTPIDVGMQYPEGKIREATIFFAKVLSTIEYVERTNTSFLN